MKLTKLLKESSLNEARDVRIGMVLKSHLSDIQHSSDADTRNKIDFIKFLLDKYLTSRELIDPDAEFKEFEQKYKR